MHSPKSFQPRSRESPRFRREESLSAQGILERGKIAFLIHGTADPSVQLESAKTPDVVRKLYMLLLPDETASEELSGVRGRSRSPSPAPYSDFHLIEVVHNRLPRPGTHTSEPAAFVDAEEAMKERLRSRTAGGLRESYVIGEGSYCLYLDEHLSRIPTVQDTVEMLEQAEPSNRRHVVARLQYMLTSPANLTQLHIGMNLAKSGTLLLRVDDEMTQSGEWASQTKRKSFEHAIMKKAARTVSRRRQNASETPTHDEATSPGQRRSSSRPRVDFYDRIRSTYKVEHTIADHREVEPAMSVESILDKMKSGKSIVTALPQGPHDYSQNMQIQDKSGRSLALHPEQRRRVIVNEPFLMSGRSLNIDRHGQRRSARLRGISPIPDYEYLDEAERMVTRMRSLSRSRSRSRSPSTSQSKHQASSVRHTAGDPTSIQKMKQRIATSGHHEEHDYADDQWSSQRHPAYVSKMAKRVVNSRERDPDVSAEYECSVLGHAPEKEYAPSRSRRATYDEYDEDEHKEQGYEKRASMKNKTEIKLKEEAVYGSKASDLRITSRHTKPQVRGRTVTRDLKSYNLRSRSRSRSVELDFGELSHFPAHRYAPSKTIDGEPAPKTSASRTRAAAEQRDSVRSRSRSSSRFHTPSQSKRVTHKQPAHNTQTRQSATTSSSYKPAETPLLTAEMRNSLVRQSKRASERRSRSRSMSVGLEQSVLGQLPQYEFAPSRYAGTTTQSRSSQGSPAVEKRATLVLAPRRASKSTQSSDHGISSTAGRKTGTLQLPNTDIVTRSMSPRGKDGKFFELDIHGKPIIAETEDPTIDLNIEEGEQSTQHRQRSRRRTVSRSISPPRKRVAPSKSAKTTAAESEEAGLKRGRSFTRDRSTSRSASHTRSMSPQVKRRRQMSHYETEQDVVTLVDPYYIQKSSRMYSPTEEEFQMTHKQMRTTPHGGSSKDFKQVSPVRLGLQFVGQELGTNLDIMPDNAHERLVIDQNVVQTLNKIVANYP